MTRGRRADTETRAKGLDARLEAAYAWLTGRGRWVLFGLGALLVLGALATGLSEYRARREARAQLALAEVEDAFSRAMGSQADVALVPEPANPDQARKAREQALAGFDSVAAEHPGSRAARIARVRAGAMEADLGAFQEAEKRLQAAVGGLDEEDALRAIALRLLGFVQEQQGRFAEAGASYARAAAVKAYPDSGALWIAAGESFAQAGAAEDAVNAFQEALAADPELAERSGLLERLAALTGR